ncbi:MAG: hypothetical protein R3A79_07485 [Nannocystaceae bacterium]
MSLWRRLFRRSRPLRVDDYGELAGATLRDEQLVELTGEIEALESIVDPIAGGRFVVLEYGAWPQSTTPGIDGASPTASSAFQLTCHQATDFVLVKGGKRLLIRVDRGRDVGELHGELIDRYGLSLRAEAHGIRGGDRVRVLGAIERLAAVGSPMRGDPYLAVIAAQRIWPLVADV